VNLKQEETLSQRDASYRDPFLAHLLLDIRVAESHGVARSVLFPEDVRRARSGSRDVVWRSSRVNAYDSTSDAQRNVGHMTRVWPEVRPETHVAATNRARAPLRLRFKNSQSTISIFCFFCLPARILIGCCFFVFCFSVKMWILPYVHFHQCRSILISV